MHEAETGNAVAVTKSIRSKKPVANVIQRFWHYYIAIGATSVKIIGKYATTSVNYA